MPHIALPQLIFLCVVLAGFFSFMATLIYVSVWAMVAETSVPDVTTDVTPAQRAADSAVQLSRPQIRGFKTP